MSFPPIIECRHIPEGKGRENKKKKITITENYKSMSE